MKEYAFEGFRSFTGKEYWADSYKTLGDARRAAKEWVNRTPGKYAILLKKKPNLKNYEFGAEWEEVGVVKCTT